MNESGKKTEKKQKKTMNLQSILSVQVLQGFRLHLLLAVWIYPVV